MQSIKIKFINRYKICLKFIFKVWKNSKKFFFRFFGSKSHSLRKSPQKSMFKASHHGVLDHVF